MAQAVIFILILAVAIPDQYVVFRDRVGWELSGLVPRHRLSPLYGGEGGEGGDGFIGDLTGLQVVFL